jgi:hypothetical protein
MLRFHCISLLGDLERVNWPWEGSRSSVRIPSLPPMLSEARKTFESSIYFVSTSERGMDSPHRKPVRVSI